MPDSIIRRFIVEADGGSRGNPGVAGYGALILDRETGRVLAERAEPLGIASNNVAEYSGLIAGLALALRLAGVQPVDVEARMDSKLVVEQMSGRWKIKHEDMRRLAQDAKQLAAQILEAGGTCRFSWIPRERNTKADRLSNLAMDGQSIDRLVPQDDTPQDDTPRDDTAQDDTAQDADVSPGVIQDEAGSGPRGATLRTTKDAPIEASKTVDRPEPDEAPEPADLESHVEAARAVATGAVGRPARAADQGVGVRLVLARHGVTDATALGRMDGRGGLDPPLNAEGTRQAQQLATGVREFLGTATPIVITSALRRAQETGRHVAAVFDVTAAADEDWDELHFGDWNGRTMREIWAEDPAGLAVLLDEPTSRRQGGESRADLARRVEGAVDRAFMRAREAAAPVIVVTHRGAIVAALAYLVGIGVRATGAFATGPASLTSVRQWSDGGVLVEFVNDRSHLRPQ